MAAASPNAEGDNTGGDADIARQKINANIATTFANMGLQD